MYISPESDIFQPIYICQWLYNGNMYTIFIHNNANIIYQYGDNKVIIPLKKPLNISTWYKLSIWFTYENIIFYV